MPTKTDIQKAAQRIRKGDGFISAILKAKQDATEALNSGDMTKLRAAGYKTFSFDAASL